MTDTAAVAGLLWDGWLPSSVRRGLAASFGGDETEVRTALVWLACAHDLGKASPTFAFQVESLASRMEDQGLSIPQIARSYDTKISHSTVSQYLLERWLIERQGWTLEVARSWSVVLGSHHGSPPTERDLAELRRSPKRLGSGPVWAGVHGELADFAARTAGAHLDAWATVPLPKTAQQLLTAAVIVADWIASGELFPFDEAARPSAARAADAWARLGLIGPWHAAPPPEGSTVDVRLRERFEMPDGAAARPTQTETVAIAQRLRGPGLLIIEAPMGEGKTEAALLAAEEFAAATGAGGVLFALPTMATSNGMFPRVHRWVHTVADAPQSAYLAHGKAQLNEEYRGLDRVGRIDFIGEPTKRGASDDVMVAHAWLRGRKKGLLANFVVGTIDQVLFAGLKTRHVMLRHLALADKVVVIDEVHSSDAYMKVYLNRVLRWLGAYRVPTILMSATLTPADRRGFAAEYARADPQSFDDLAAERSYPLITAVSPDGATEMVRPAPSGRGIDVHIDPIDDDDATLVEALRTALVDGGCVGVVRNTVQRAQDTARLLTDVFPGADVRLLHSRFLAVDRVVKEQTLLTELGPEAHRGDAVRFGGRPLIVVGTQVLEQSLDIDFDLLVSDLAPVDLLLQRAGRLHRHERANRATNVSVPRLLVTGVDRGSTPPTPVSGSVAVYGAKPLLAALAVLDQWLAGHAPLRFPRDIAGLVADADDPHLAPPPSWVPAWERAVAEWKRASSDRAAAAAVYLLDAPDSPEPNLLGLLTAAVEEESRHGHSAHAAVRDGEDTLEVLVVQRVDGVLRTLPGIPDYAGQQIPEDADPGTRLALAIAGCSIRLPRALSGSWVVDAVIGDLEHNRFDGWQQSSVLRGELVLVLDEQFTAIVAGHSVRYDREYGLQIKRLK